ncbi:MAG: hypothetical protein DSY59_01810 [Persephonella sp.]|nr:MAG: hypothetical protein DSY59_01810 [Persephonella sp.]
MLDRFKSLRIIVDTLAILLVYMVIGYFIDHNDILLINKPFQTFIIVIAVISLFYGFPAGILSMLMFLVIGFSFYSQFPLYQFLWYLALTLIFSEAHYFWSSKILKLEKEMEYLNEKLRYIKESLFTLKISHDQIEKNYVLKPMSIRNVLNEINKMVKTKDEKLFENFLLLISKYTQVESGSLYIRDEKDKETYVEVAKIGDGADLDFEDPMMKEVMERRESAFLSIADLDGNNPSKYLAVSTVLDDNNEFKVFFLIKEMPFTELNKDNMLKIDVFLLYLVRNIDIVRNYDRILEKYIDLDMYLIREIDILIQLYRKYKIESNIVVFYVDEGEPVGSMFMEIEGSIRGLDYAVRYRYGNREMLIVLLPFTSDANVKGFIGRIRKDIRRLFGRDTELSLLHKIIPIGKFSLEKTIYKVVKS